MPVSPGLRRLLRIRRLEEDLKHQVLAVDLGELRTVENALSAIEARMRQCRRSLPGLLAADDRPGVTAALNEALNLDRQSAILVRWADALQQRAEQSRSQWLGKRTERRQAETLAGNAAQNDALLDGRRVQQSMDQWYLARRDLGIFKRKAEAPLPPHQ